MGRTAIDGLRFDATRCESIARTFICSCVLICLHRCSFRSGIEVLFQLFNKTLKMLQSLGAATQGNISLNGQPVRILTKHVAPDAILGVSKPISRTTLRQVDSA